MIKKKKKSQPKILYSYIERKKEKKKKKKKKKNPVDKNILVMHSSSLFSRLSNMGGTPFTFLSLY